MKKVAVAFMDQYDLEIVQKVVEVADNATWKDALKKAYEVGLCNECVMEVMANLSDDLDEARLEMAEREIDLCVTFI